MVYKQRKLLLIKKFSHWVIAMFIILPTIQVYGQDTLSVYFEFGHSKLPPDQLEKLDNIPTNYDLSELDSVHFIGMTDSVGNLKANIKLSEKRAKNTEQYCQQLLPKNIATQIIALGETRNNKRVDIILYFRPNLEEDDEDEVTQQYKVEDVCYNIDYNLLHRCHLRAVTKRKKEYIIIETTLPDVKKKKEHYYGLTTTEGDFIVKKVKWTKRRTGNLWWSKTRYVASIPKENFKSYKVFKIGSLPCDSCNEEYATETKIVKEDTCIQVDRFLMENTQFKAKFLTNKSVKIRTPREYVNLEDSYFIGCNLQHELLWKTKKRRRKKKYLYSKIPRYYNHIANITRVMNCCKSNPEPSKCKEGIIFCATLQEPDRSFILNTELGNLFQQSTSFSYATLGVSKEGFFSRASIQVGTDIDQSFYSALRYQYHFLSFPFNALNPKPTWQSPTAQRFISRYARLYLGTELSSRIHQINTDYFEQNIHLGIAAVNTDRDALIPRIFVQLGMGTNYLDKSSFKAYSIVQLGLNVKIARLNTK